IEGQGDMKLLVRTPARAWQAGLAPLQGLGDIPGNGQGGEQSKHGRRIVAPNGRRKPVSLARPGGDADISLKAGGLPRFPLEIDLAMSDFRNGFSNVAPAT